MSLKSAPLSTIEKKERARWARIKRVYGLTKEDYDSLNTGACPICLRNFDNTVRPVVDHDHKTGEVRGILCFFCNHRRVGNHRDSLLLRRMVEYLEKPRLGYLVPPKKRKKRVRRRPK